MGRRYRKRSKQSVMEQVRALVRRYYERWRRGR